MIAHEYMRKAGIVEHKPAQKWNEERGTACYSDYYTLQPNTKNVRKPYKKPTEKELKSVLEILKDHPEIQKCVQEDLKNL